MIKRVRPYIGSVVRRLSAALSSRRELRDRINIVYQHYLGRDVDPDGLRHYIAVLRHGMPFSRVVQAIEASPEAARHRQDIEKGYASAVNLVSRHFLGRDADPESIQHFTTAMRDGMSFFQLAQEIEASPEAEHRRQDIERDYASAVKLAYRHFLGRDADPEGIQHFTTAMRDGMSFFRLAQEIEASPEAEQRRLNGVLGDLSDGEFILAIAELLFEGRGATPPEIERWRKFLGENRAMRSELIGTLINDRVAKQRLEVEPWNPHRCWIMGTDRYLTLADWQERAKELKLSRREAQPAKPVEIRGGFKHSGDYLVSAIASLYKGRRFLEGFLENITSQTIFDRSELIIVDANSPENEEKIVNSYQKIYPNIVYKRINYRIGVYDAWNIGVQMARGKYLTNTNVDDLRRRDSFEMQATALDRNPWADIVYQDFLYSFDASLSFDEVVKFEFKSALPIVTANNLLVFNSPHNAPMWRKSLHQELGLFDTSFKSAGDWEFWLRCLWKGKKFFKINTPHVVYFQNPEGLSTRADTRGVEEAREVLNRYARKLISAHLLMSRQEFADALGVEPDWDWDLSYYGVVQRQLKLLGERKKADGYPEEWRDARRATALHGADGGRSGPEPGLEEGVSEK
jgi:glycosyltransferase involved in cell wall biosynthesis